MPGPHEDIPDLLLDVERGKEPEDPQKEKVTKQADELEFDAFGTQASTFSGAEASRGVMSSPEEPEELEIPHSSPCKPIGEIDLHDWEPPCEEKPVGELDWGLESTAADRFEDVVGDFPENPPFEAGREVGEKSEVKIESGAEDEDESTIEDEVESNTEDEDEDVPWPRGLTPQRQDVEVQEETIAELANFGFIPRVFWQTPAYALRVYLSQRVLREKKRLAQVHFSQLELRRDKSFASLAEGLRKDLEHHERFSHVYDGVDAQDKEISARRLLVEKTDAQGAEVLVQVQSRLDVMNAERVILEKERESSSLKFEQSAQEFSRGQARVQRSKIELRNIESRLKQEPEGEGEEGLGELSHEGDRLYQALSKATEVAQVALDLKKRAAADLEAAEDKLRLLVANFQAVEGEKEGLLFSSEGEMSSLVSSLEEVESLRELALADAGRMIVDLRGEIPVRGAVRRRLLDEDERVTTAFEKMVALELAGESMDASAYNWGRFLSAGIICLLLGVLILL